MADLLGFGLELMYPQSNNILPIFEFLQLRSPDKRYPILNISSEVGITNLLRILSPYGFICAYNTVFNLSIKGSCSFEGFSINTGDALYITTTRNLKVVISQS